ncbi:MAG: hypothetical protein CMJ51_06895 [Planctomycetaceae bacterium]|nr:hypothetical protein [Planctomycetaceae bacterium]
MSVLVIFNPISGAGRARLIAERVQAEAIARGVEIDLLPTRPGAAAPWLRGPLEGRNALVVVGGDGAIRLAAPEASRAGVPIVHCPAGNENLFARDHGMTADPAAVAATLVEGRVHRIDLARARVTGRPDEVVVLMASFGFDAEVVHDLSGVRTGAVSNLSYLRPSLRQFRAFDPPRMKVEVDGRSVADGIRGLAMVANSRQYAGRIDLARRARADDGLLDLVILPCEGRWQLPGWLLRARLGLHLRDSRLIYATGKKIDLEFDPARRWQVDGDPPDQPAPVRSITFEIEPGVLPVLTPSGFQAG